MEKSIRDRQEYQRQHYLKNKERKDAYAKKYREENRDKVLGACRKCNKDWFQRNKERVYKRRNERLKSNPYVRLTENLRKRLKGVVKKEWKSGSALTLLGCSVEYFKKHIESQFKDGMTWENYGHKTWHIDHIKPIASFDLTNPEHQKICFHYTNMQPLLAFDNHSKGAKI